MKVYITGVSKGLGKALAEHFLLEGNSVIGIGRGHSIQHPNFSFIHCDLRKLDEVKKITFESDESGLMLINNAGVIGNIERVSDQEFSDIEEVMTVNSLAPMYLCQRLLRQMPLDQKISILNISSGAANRAIPSWAAYCASKSALDRFSETIYLEEVEKGREIAIYSVAPGVIDTAMQEKIRSTDPSDFSSLPNFVALNENAELQSTEQTVAKMDQLLKLPFNGKVISSLKDLN
jgi:benzil reductase ((S)-benzoin forming)